MSKIDYQALREAVEKATKGKWAVEFDDEIYSTDGINHEQIAMVFSENESRDAEFIAAANPATVLALLGELEAAENNLIDSECHVAELEEALRDKQALLEASEKRIAELEAELVSQTYKLHELSGNYPVTPDSWISCSERMPVIGELNWRTGFPLLITCEIGVIPAYYGFVSVNGDKHYGFMESFKYGDDRGGHPKTNEYGLISNVTHWMPLPEPPQEVNRG
ncbi:ead/Ea22-like family protein [Salmonella enterica]|uniref:ead/Ea22-like family protein n=1 Tax=Salmonella enterica TaxID=28901 RepID=UPI003CEE4228